MKTKFFSNGLRFFLAVLAMIPGVIAMLVRYPPGRGKTMEDVQPVDPSAAQ
jgi:hypothetical protein